MSKVTYLLKKRASCDIHWDVHPDPLHRKACPSLLLGVLPATAASCQLLQSLPKLDRVPWPRIHPSQGTPNPMADYHWGLRSNLLGSLKNSCNSRKAHIKHSRSAPGQSWKRKSSSPMPQSQASSWQSRSLPQRGRTFTTGSWGGL